LHSLNSKWWLCVGTDRAGEALRQTPAAQVQCGVSIGMRNRSARARGIGQEGAGGWTVVQPGEYHIGHVRGRPVLAGVRFLPDTSDEATMEIRFPADAPAYRDSNLTVVFPALVDGEAVPCAISVEALEDHFGAYSEDLDGWLRAFDAGRPRIEAVAREHLQISNGTPVLLRSGHFPPGNIAL
jgi:hypothetical protein